MATRLIIDGNTVYEIDEDCLENFRRRENSCRRSEKIRRRRKNHRFPQGRRHPFRRMPPPVSQVWELCLETVCGISSENRGGMTGIMPPARELRMDVLPAGS